MAHVFWSECVNFIRDSDGITDDAVEAVSQDLRSLLQWPGQAVERVGHELTGEWATLAHLVASLAICSVNCQAEYWQSSWTLLVTAQDEVRITRLTDLSAGLESVCMSPASLRELVHPLSDDARHHIVHSLLAASGLLAQVCCATPPRQPFNTFTTWVEYARLLETLPSPVALSIPSASALHLLMHWLKSTAPFPKFLQNSIIPAAAAAVSNTQNRMVSSQTIKREGGVPGVPNAADPQPVDQAGHTSPCTDKHEEENAAAADDSQMRAFRDVLRVVLVVLESCLSLAGFPVPGFSPENRSCAATNQAGYEHGQTGPGMSSPCSYYADPGDAVASTFCVFFVEVLRSCEPSLAEPYSAAPSAPVAMQPLPHASLSSLVGLQREMLEAAAAHVHACCNDDMPPTIAAVRHVLPLCAHTMPARCPPPPPNPFHGLLLLADAAVPHMNTPARQHTRGSTGVGLGGNLMAWPSPAESWMGSAVELGSSSAARDSSRIGTPGISRISGGCFPGTDVGPQCHSTAETADIGLGDGRQWQHPVLQAVLEVVFSSANRCEELEDIFEETESGLVQYASETLRAQRLLCFALAVAPYATLPAKEVTQARLIKVISKLFIAHLPESSTEDPAVQQHPYNLPDATPAQFSFSPEMQAHAANERHGWYTPLPAGGCAAPYSSAGLVDCSRVVRGALRHNFATLVAAVLSSVADDSAEGTSVDVAAAANSNAAACPSSVEIPRCTQAQQSEDECGSDCKPITLTLAVTQALQVAIKHLCSHVSEATASLSLPAPKSAHHHPHGCNQADAGPVPPQQTETNAVSVAGGSQAVATSDSAAVHRINQQGHSSTPGFPSIHTPAMLGGASASKLLPASTGQGSLLLGGRPSVTPPEDTKPSIQHGISSSVCVSRSFTNVNHALIDCIERAFDAANNRWADEEPGVFAGTPMYPGVHTPSQNHSAAIPEEVESVLALCCTLGEEFEAVLPQDMLAARMNHWLTSMCVDPLPPLAAKSAQEDTASPLLQLHSPLSPFGGYGPARSTGFVVTMMHAVPMPALVASLEAAMKLPMHALSGVAPNQHMRSMVRLRAQMNAACSSTVRSAHKAVHASDDGPSPAEAVQAVAAATTAMSCAIVAMGACGSFTASLAHQQVSLSALQAVPQALHTLYDVSWRSPRPNTQSSIQKIMMQLIQNTSHCEMYNSLASVALDMVTPAAPGGTETNSDAAAPSQWLPVAVFAISALTACAVASVPDNSSIPPQGSSQPGAPGPVNERVSREQVSVVLAAALKLILRAVMLPALSGKGGAKKTVASAAAQACGEAQGSVTSQQWRAWLTVLMQLCLEAAAAELEAPVSEVSGSSASDFETLQSVLVEAGNYLTSAKQRDDVSSLLWWALFPTSQSSILRAVGRAAANSPTAGAAVVALMRALAARKCECPNGKRLVTWIRVHEVVCSTQLSVLWPLHVTTETAPMKEVATAARKPGGTAPSALRKRKICAVDVHTENDDTGTGVNTAPVAKGGKALKPTKIAVVDEGKVAAVRDSAVTASTGPGFSNSHVQSAAQVPNHAAGLSQTSSVRENAETEAARMAKGAGETDAPETVQTAQAGGDVGGTGKQRMRLRSSGKWLRACMHVVGAATAQRHSHALTSARSRSSVTTAGVAYSWQHGVEKVSRVLDNIQGSQGCAVSLLRLASTLLRIDTALTARSCASSATATDPEKDSAAGGASTSAGCRNTDAAVKSEAAQNTTAPVTLNRTDVTAAAVATGGNPVKREVPAGTSKNAAKRSAGGSNSTAPANLQPAATVSVLAVCTSVEMMCDGDGKPASSAQDPASIEASRRNSACAESNLESVLLHLSLVFAPVVTPEAAAAASCMHLLAFSRRYAGVGYPAGTAYMPAWAEQACMSALPKCMHDSIRIGRSLVRTRLASASDAATPDVRPLWVFCELMRRCSEATAGILVKYSSEGSHVKDLEAPVPNGSSVPDRSIRKPGQSQAPLQELLLCIVCLAATHGGLTISDAEQTLCSAASSSGNSVAAGAATSDARRAVTCLSAAVPGPRALADTHTAAAGSGSPDSSASHSHLIRGVLYLCRSHLEHVLWALAHGVEMAVTQVHAMLDSHEKGLNVKPEVVIHDNTAPPKSSGARSVPPRFSSSIVEVEAAGTFKQENEFPSPAVHTTTHMHTSGTSAATPVLQQPAQSASLSSPRYSLRNNPTPSVKSPRKTRQTSSRMSPVPSCTHQTNTAATAGTPTAPNDAATASASQGSNAKASKAAVKSMQCASVGGAGGASTAPATARSDEQVVNIAQLLCSGIPRQQQEPSVNGGTAATTPPVPHSAAVAAMRLISSFSCAQRVILELVTELKSERQPAQKLPDNVCASDGAARAAFSARCTPASASTCPSEFPAAKPGVPAAQCIQTPHLRSHPGTRDPQESAGGTADATANLLLSSAIRTPTTHDNEQLPQVSVKSQRLQKAMDRVKGINTMLMARLRRLADGHLTADRIQTAGDKFETQTPAAVDSVQKRHRRSYGSASARDAPASAGMHDGSACGDRNSRRAVIAAALLETLKTTEVDVLNFFEAPEASDAVSEDSKAAEEDTACGSAPADAASDKEGTKLRKGPVFVEPDDPMELEKDVQWMEKTREQTENDPRTRETLVQLLTLAGGGAKAIKGFDAELADLIKEHAEGGSEEDQDADSIPSESTEERSDDEDDEEVSGGDGGLCADDAVACNELEDDVDIGGNDADEDRDDSASSEDADSGSSGSESESSDSEQEGEESDSDEFRREDMQENGGANMQQEQKVDARGRGKGAQTAYGKSAKAGTSSGVELLASGSKSRSKSKSGRSQDTRSKQGVAGSSATVSNSRSREGKSNSDLPQGLQTICRAFNKRPQGTHTQEDSSKSQSRSCSKKSKSKRVADAEQINNPWLSAAVAVGEGSLDDARALADFVVAQPERDYDSLLRSRYWSNMSPGLAKSPEKLDKPKKEKT